MINKKYKISVLVFFCCIAFFFVYIEGFPVKRFTLNFLFVGFILLCAFCITKRRYTSLVFALSFTAFIMIASLMKQKYLNVYLNFDDVFFFLKNPFFIFQFVSIPIFFSLFIIWVLYIFLLYKNETKSKIKFAHVFLLLMSFGLISLRMSQYKLNETRGGPKTLHNFIYSIYSEQSLVLPKLELNNVTCCNIIHNKDLAITLPSNEKEKNIVFILLESTFNLNRIPSLHFDDQWKEFKQRPLIVYTAGGNTWTAEYAVLHGVNPTLYGKNFYRINFLGPGVLKGRIAPALKSVGYNTYSVLPHKSDFANSFNFHRSLGIDDVRDCKDSHSCSVKKLSDLDESMFNHVYQLLQGSKPAFVFALTKSQHSPHDFSTLNPAVNCQTFSSRACEVLHEYKNREEIVQKLIKEFLTKLNGLSRETIVIFFGDHIPADVNLYLDEKDFLNQLKFTTLAFGYSSRTKKFIDLQEVIGHCKKNFMLHVDDLDVLPLYMAGMQSAYISEKIAKLKSECSISTFSAKNKSNLE